MAHSCSRRSGSRHDQRRSAVLGCQPPREQTPSRAAFSLLELLVVMGILLLVASLGIAAFQRVGTVNRLTATEHLLADLIRQARLTARTSGSPVVLNIVGANGGVTPAIAGVGQTVLWSEDFDDTDFTATPPDQDTVDFRIPVGRTGPGFRITSEAKTANRFPPALPTRPADSRDPRKNALTRRASGPTEGFVLSVAVRPPLLAAGTNPPQFLPLAMVMAGPVAAGTIADADKSVCGLFLEQWTRSIFPGKGPDRIHDNGQNGPPAIPETLDPQHRFWGVTGWIRPEGSAQPIFISSEYNTLGNLDETKRQGLTQVDAGGAWEDLSLVYDGHSLLLLRDGVTIAQCRAVTDPASTTDSGAQRLVGYNQEQSVALGNARIPGAWMPPPGTTDDFVLPEQVVLDGICLARLGIDLPHNLPSGMFPSQDYQLTISPVGAVIVTAIGTVTGAQANVLEFHGTAEEKDLTARITINAANGAVTATDLKLTP